MKLFLAEEKIKRKNAQASNKKACEEWKDVKKEIESIFHEVFDGFELDEGKVRIENTLNRPLSNKIYNGYDCVQATFPSRNTGNVITTEGDHETKIDVKREVGAALSVTASATAMFSIFLIPSQSDERAIKQESLLLYSCRGNPPLNSGYS